MWCGLLSKFFNHSLSSCDRRKRLVSSLTPIHHVIPGCLNCSIPSSIIIVQCLIWWVSSSHSTNVSFHTQLWLSTQLWGLLSSSTVTKLATNASLRQSLYSKVAKGNSDKKPILNKLWWLGPTVFRGPRNFEPSRGIWPLPQNFRISAEFHGILRKHGNPEATAKFHKSVLL